LFTSSPLFPSFLHFSIGDSSDVVEITPASLSTISRQTQGGGRPPSPLKMNLSEEDEVKNEEEEEKKVIARHQRSNSQSQKVLGEDSYRPINVFDLKIHKRCVRIRWVVGEKGLFQLESTMPSFQQYSSSGGNHQTTTPNKKNNKTNNPTSFSSLSSTITSDHPDIPFKLRVIGWEDCVTGRGWMMEGFDEPRLLHPQTGMFGSQIGEKVYFKILVQYKSFTWICYKRYSQFLILDRSLIEEQQQLDHEAKSQKRMKMMREWSEGKSEFLESCSDYEFIHLLLNQLCPSLSIPPLDLPTLPAAVGRVKASRNSRSPRGT